MQKPQLDPQFELYLNEQPSLTYVQPSDNRLRRVVIDLMESALGRRRIEQVYHALKEHEFDVSTFFASALEASRIELDHRGVEPSSLNVEGPLVLLANHPFGILDGIVLCDLAIKLRGDFRIMINAVLCQDKDLAPFFLPIDFEETRDAVKTNIRSKQLALQSLADGIPVLIFPSGMVSTAGKFGFGSVVDGPWTTFAAKLVREAKATVVPVYFHGRNSRKFHIVSHIAEPLRMGMLIHEALSKFGTEVKVTMGSPLPWSVLSQYSDRKSLTQALYLAVQSLETFE